VEDLLIIGRATLGGAVVAASVVLVVPGFAGASRGVFVLNAVLLLLGVTATRLSFRWMQRLVAGVPIGRAGKPVLIWGVGERAAVLLREMLDDPGLDRRPVGFVTDEVCLAGSRVHGLPVIAAGQLAAVARAHGVAEVVVAKRHVGDDVVERLRDLGLEMRRMRVALE
jgi:FlaA1/EpsC-like NDP-sugar epimerase